MQAIKSVVIRANLPGQLYELEPEQKHAALTADNFTPHLVPWNEEGEINGGINRENGI